MIHYKVRCVPWQGRVGGTDTNTWLAVLLLEPCEAWPRPGVLRAAVSGRLAGDVAGLLLGPWRWGC